MKNQISKATETQPRFNFAEENKQSSINENKLNLQMLRVHSIEKQTVMMEVWAMNQQKICSFFTSYQLFPQSDFRIKELLKSKNLKLVKNHDKIYFGQVERKKRSGKGVYITKEGKLYEGQFKDNERNGKGVQIYENGNLYIGQFLNNKKHGHGKFFWFNITQKHKKQIQHYDGEWWGGLPDGEGIHQKYNGDSFCGTFKNGLKHGFGQEYFENGDFYKGQYINGLPQGFGEYLWKDKSYYKGDFKQGLRSGYGYWCMSAKDNGQNYQGHYLMDKKSGYGIYEWEKGWKYKGNFQDDYRNGYGELYNENQNLIYKGYWENGKQIQGRPSTVKSIRKLKKQKSVNMTQRNFQTMNFQDTKYKIVKPGYRKRPQSYSTSRKSTIFHQNKHNETSSSYKSSMVTAETKPIVNFTNVYVPWQHSNRIYK